MLLFISICLAVFVLPSPWGLVAVAIGATLEIVEASFFIWYSKRRQAAVGVDSLVGKQGVAIDALWPEGQVRIRGEIWKARCRGGCDPGAAVVVRSVDGLVLEVEPA